MEPEERKFLDLDFVGERIRHDGDREMFREAVKCYHIESNRASIILVWSVTAACLQRRIEELATEGDGIAKESLATLKDAEGSARYEETLIGQAKRCELIDDYEERCLRFARDLRSKCAHPTGVTPSAEAVRHILEISSATVLTRSGYRGTSFIRNIVTIQCDDPYFLPSADRCDEHCRSIIGKVPSRLWPLFPKLAAEERPTAGSESWRINILRLFRELLRLAEHDGLAGEIAAAMRGFEEHAPEFFATLVGIDPRVERFWERQKRDQARFRLANSALTKVSKEQVESWAHICARDGFDDLDMELIRSRISVIAQYLPETLLVSRRNDLLGVLVTLAEDDYQVVRATAALRCLLKSSLFEQANELSRSILKQIILWYPDNDKYREVIENVCEWRDESLGQFLSMSEDFLVECSEDRPDDIIILFEAASELAARRPILIPEAFASTVVRVLRNEIQAEWRSVESTAGDTFLRQLMTLLERYPEEFSSLSTQTTELVGQFRAVGEPKADGASDYDKEREL